MGAKRGQGLSEAEMFERGSYRTTSLILKIVFGLSVLAFLLHMVGYFSPYWSEREFIPPKGLLTVENEGLWKMCRATLLHFICRNVRTSDSWFEAVQAFETIGFIAAIAALVLIVLYIFVPATSGKRIVFILTMLACFAAAGCIILGIIIYGAKVENNLSWSFALCTIAGIIFGICGILLVVDMLKR